MIEGVEILVMWGMTLSEGAYVILERPLVLEVGAADAEPELPAVLLVRAPVAAHGEGLAALPAAEGFGAVLPLVVCLECPKILQRLRPRMIYVVLTPLRAAVARHPEYRRRRLRASEGFRPFPIF